MIVVDLAHALSIRLQDKPLRCWLSLKKEAYKRITLRSYKKLGLRVMNGSWRFSFTCCHSASQTCLNQYFVTYTLRVLGFSITVL